LILFLLKFIHNHMDYSSPKRNQNYDSEEEKEDRPFEVDSYSPEIKTEEFIDQEVPQADDFLSEFKKKYQTSLEAIQSFQEILELKRNFPNLKHSYNPVSLSLFFNSWKFDNWQKWCFWKFVKLFGQSYSR